MKYSGFAIAGAALPASAREHDCDDDDDGVVQVVDAAELYMTHYAFFEEPDDKVPAALYFDAATGQPTHELELAPPLYTRRFRHGRLQAPATASKLLPYFVEPPGFPPLPAPPPIVGFIQQATGLPADLIAANTEVLLVAIGQFLAEGPARARLHRHTFTVEETVHFEVRIRTGFVFTPPAGLAAPSIGILTGYLDFGLLHQLIQLPPPSNASEVVVYSWRAPMTFSTENRFVRSIAGEPPPVADSFPPGMSELRFTGSPVDHHGNYTLVGSARPADVEFLAPPELELFLFGQSSLSDVEFAVLQRGRLLRDDD